MIFEVCEAAWSQVCQSLYSLYLGLMGVEIGDNMVIIPVMALIMVLMQCTKSDVLTVLNSECRCHTVATYPCRELKVEFPDMHDCLPVRNTLLYPSVTLILTVQLVSILSGTWYADMTLFITSRQPVVYRIQLCIIIEVYIATLVFDTRYSTHLHNHGRQTLHWLSQQPLCCLSQQLECFHC